MKIISTKIHGILDYVMGTILLLMPALLGLDRAAIESMLFYSCGTLMLLMALLTQYEPGIFKLVPVPVHLTIDILPVPFLHCHLRCLVSATRWSFPLY